MTRVTATDRDGGSGTLPSDGHPKGGAGVVGCDPEGFAFSNEERVRRIVKYAAASDEATGREYRPRCEQLRIGLEYLSPGR